MYKSVGLIQIRTILSVVTEFLKFFIHAVFAPLYIVVCYGSRPPFGDPFKTANSHLRHARRYMVVVISVDKG